MLTAALRFGGRVVRGLLAAVVLLALVAGLPWALVRFVGWPLPDHLPSWDEIQAVLLNPMTAQFLLNILACLCWIVWFFFVLDVVLCSVDAARGITWPNVRPPGPLQGLAAALIGTVVLTLLTNRTPYTPPQTPLTLTSAFLPVAVTAPLHPGSAQPAAVAQQTTLTIDRAAPAPAGMVQVTEEVRLPQDGVYDSLSRVADRIFGDANRWPELFQHNRGVEQADGRALTNPNLVRPGWKITAYIPTPAASVVPPPQDQQPPAPPQQPSPTTTTPTTPPPSAQPAPTSQAPAASSHGGDHATDRGAPGLDLVSGGFVSLGLAAAVATAVASALMWRRRRYRIGSGDRADLQRPIAPVVRALRTAHEHEDPLSSVTDVEFVELAPAAPGRLHINATGGAIEPDEEPVPVTARVGVRDGRELALNLASTRGLGLAGPGATAAARSLLLHLLAEPLQLGESIRVIVPADDLTAVFDGANVENLPSTVVVVDSLDAALDEMETALLSRTRQLMEDTGPRPAAATLVLIGSPAPHAERRLQAVLDNGSVFGLAGVLLGQWRPGATVRVRFDGTVSATSPGLGDGMAGMRLFTVPTADATELLAVLHDAEGPADLSTPEPPHRATDDAQFVEDIPADTDSKQSPAVPDQHTVVELARLESTCPPTAADDGGAATDDAEPGVGQPSLEHTQQESANIEEASTRRPLTLRVLGPVQLVLHGDEGPRELGGALTPKQRELLAYLALHVHGTRREALNDAVWPDARPPRPFNSLHNALSLLRRELNTATDGAIRDLVLNDDGRYHLNTDLVTTDVGQVQHALQAPREAGNGGNLTALRQAVELYHADLAEDLTAPWIEPFREALRRDVLDALGVLIRAHGETDPETKLMLLERTRKLDHYNEGIYRNIIRTQARLGQYDAIPRTLALLATTLADIHQRPDADTLNLADFLQRRGSTRRPASSDNAAAS
jgi:DNA-binding SARP family transcriptional activator